MTGPANHFTWSTAACDGRYPTGLGTWRGETAARWPLEEHSALGLAVRADGLCAVVQPHHLVAMADGSPLWSVQSRDLVTAWSLSGHHLWVAAGGELTAHDVETGEVSGRHPLGGAAWGMCATPDGGIVLNVHPPAGRPELCRLEGGSGTLSRVALSTGSTQPPRWLDSDDGGAILALDGRLLTAHSPDLERLWSAGREGFRSAGHRPLAPAKGPDSGEAVVTRLLVADPLTVLVGISWRSGLGYFRFDLKRHRVSELNLSTPLPHLRLPAVLAGAAAAARLVTFGVDRHPICLDLDGRLLWRHEEISPPLQVSAAEDGVAVSVHGPEISFWERYRDHLEHPATFVRLRDLTTGTDRGLWEAPGPISPCAAIGPDGLLAVSEGHLYLVR